MNHLHNHLTQKSNLYRIWHQTKHHNKIHWGVFIAYSLFIFSLIFNPFAFTLDSNTSNASLKDFLAPSVSKAQISLEVPLTVSEISGINRVEEPVTSGIPLPKSLNILTTNSLGIFDGATEIPAQFKVTARWGGAPTVATKPIKWLLVDFQATVSANTSKVYTLKNTGIGNASGILANFTSGTVTVNTGDLRFTIKQNGFNLFNEAWYDPTGNFGTGTQIITSDQNNGGFILSGGTTYSAYRHHTPKSYQD